MEEAPPFTLCCSLLNLPATEQATTNHGSNYRNCSTMCDPVRIHSTQASNESNDQAGSLATPTPPQQSRDVWRSYVLNEVLGSWLEDEQHALTELLRDQRDDANVGRELYREMLQDNDVAWNTALERMKTKVECRDIVINMLTHACLKMLTNQPDDVLEERLQPCFAYIMDMRRRALETNEYTCMLMSDEELRRNVNLEMTAEVLIDLTTDEDSDSEIIDLTEDSDSEMEE